MTPRLVVTAITAAALLAGCAPGETGDTEAGRIAALEAQVAVLEDDNAALQQELEGAEERLAELHERAVEEAPVPLPPNTVEGLEDALRAYLRHPAVPWSPGVTRWRDTDLELPTSHTDPQEGAASHGELTLELVDAVIDAEQFGGGINAEFSSPWEITARVLRTGEQEALAIVQQWGTGDDSVAGSDYLFTLNQGDGGWYVSDVAERNQCTRNDRLPGEDDLPELCV